MFVGQSGLDRFQPSILKINLVNVSNLEADIAGNATTDESKNAKGGFSESRRITTLGAPRSAVTMVSIAEAIVTLSPLPHSVLFNKI